MVKSKAIRIYPYGFFPLNLHHALFVEEKCPEVGPIHVHVQWALGCFMHKHGATLNSASSQGAISMRLFADHVT
jgi:hypothetical protein